MAEVEAKCGGVVLCALETVANTTVAATPALVEYKPQIPGYKTSSMYTKLSDTFPIRIEVENTSDVEVHVVFHRDEVLSNASTNYVVDGDYDVVLAPFERCSMVIEVRCDD